MKTLIIHILPAIILYSSCCENATKDFVHKFDRTIALGRKNKFFYSSYNLILTPNNNIYFHSKDSLLNCCDTGADYNYPDYIGLDPVNVSPINKNDVIRMIKASAIQKKEDKHSIQIALYSDTICNSEFKNLILLLDSLHFDNFDVRLITEEEKVVLEHKLNEQPYNFYKIHWESRFSNTVFPPPMPVENN